MSADHFDTIIVGGAVIGSSVAYFLSENPDHTGTVLVVEPDPTYALSSTTLSCASIRHQFSNPVNVELSLFGTEFLANFHDLVESGATRLISASGTPVTSFSPANRDGPHSRPTTRSSPPVVQTLR